MSAQDAVIYAQEGGVVTLTLNEPDTRNAISPAIVDGITSACARINADMSVCCVVITGAGKSFSSGGNVKEMRERTGLFGGTPLEARRGYQHGIQRIPEAMQAIEVPTIAAVNGHAVGAGCDLSMMCDIRVAAEDAEFSESFLRVGLISGDGGAWFLPRVIGLSRAMEMTFTCDVIKAQQAYAWGMVNHVVPVDQLLPEAQKLAKRIAAQPPQSLRLSKKLIRESHGIPLRASLEMAAGMQALVQSSQDQSEAVTAFFEKRAPKFVGK
ncbi:crotonase/enoyl-CoA hydratase family protein [Ferrovibrio sp.]|uniref:crotonase/enoyl-CoA hydratase family protein n=1 Tax=Ferrovibrio sp. TaxID=1917215 RepID=UPI003D2D4D10